MKTRFKAAVPMVALSVTALVVAGCSSSSNGGGGGGGSAIKVGLINSYTGSESVFAAQFQAGFDAGLSYLTNGTNTVAGHKVEITKGDDTGSPSTGTNLAKNMIASGAKFIIGPTDSSVAVPVAQVAAENKVIYLGGLSGTDELTGMSPYVFAMSGYSKAGNQLFKTLLGSDTQGKTIADIEQDYAYGQSLVAGNSALMKPLGITLKSYLLPQTTTDFTAVALQIKKSHPDFLTTGWSAGAGQAALYGTLASQGIFDTTKYIGTITTKTEWPSIGPAFGKQIGSITFGMGYWDGATDNAEAKALHNYTTKNKVTDDLGDLTGWNDAAALVHAVKTAGTSDTTKMADSLNNYKFESPAGETEIRGADHLLLSPSFTLHLVQKNGTWGAQLVKAYSAAELTPPVTQPLPK